VFFVTKERLWIIYEALKIVFIINEFASAFFFVIYPSLPILRFANEKDSAFVSCNYTRSNRFKMSVQSQNVFTIFDDYSCALACPAGGASGRA